MDTFELAVIFFLAAIAGMTLYTGGILDDIRGLLREISQATSQTAESARRIEDSVDTIQAYVESSETLVE